MITRHPVRRVWALAAVGVIGIATQVAAAQPLPEAATFGVESAEIVGDKLEITGTTKSKNKQVVLDGKFKTKSNSNGVFSFSVSYLPPDCVGTLAAEGKVIDAAISNCGQTGPQGKRGKRGKRGATGATGAAGATGPAGDKGPKGKKGATGNAGLDGADGPKGTSGFTGGIAFVDLDGGSVTTSNISDLAFIGDTQDVMLPANVPLLATVRGSAQGPATSVNFSICYQVLPSGPVLWPSTTIQFVPLATPAPIGQILRFQVSTTTTYRVGICAATDGLTLNVNWFSFVLLGHEAPLPDALPTASADPGLSANGGPLSAAIPVIRLGGGS